MISHSKALSKNNIDYLFSVLASKYKELGGHETVEIFLVGGAAIITRFQYRAMTLDVDAVHPKTKPFMKAIEEVANQESLPQSWINDEFASTPSYSETIIEKAKLYKSFGNNLIKVYCLPEVYLIAMKMRSGRPTGGDLDDVLRMVAELKHNGKRITYAQIEKAYLDLYGEKLDRCDSLFVSELKTIIAMSKDEIDELYYPQRF